MAKSLKITIENKAEAHHDDVKVISLNTLDNFHYTFTPLAFQILTLFLDQPQPKTISEISNQLHTDDATIKQPLVALVTAGILNQWPDSNLYELPFNQIHFDFVITKNTPFQIKVPSYRIKSTTI